MTPPDLVTLGVGPESHDGVSVHGPQKVYMLKVVNGGSPAATANCLEGLWCDRQHKIDVLQVRFIHV